MAHGREGIMVSGTLIMASIAVVSFVISGQMETLQLFVGLQVVSIVSAFITVFLGLKVINKREGQE